MPKFNTKQIPFFHVENSTIQAPQNKKNVYNTTIFSTIVRYKICM